MTIGTFTDLTVTENFADDTKLTETQLTAANTSIETFCNTTLTRNLEQLAKDCFGNSNYTFDSDGAANLTNTLFEKQVVQDYYNGGAVSLGTSADAAWGDVDATNAAITITPEIAGKYRAVFTFSHKAESTAATDMDVDVAFRLTDGTDSSYAINSGGYTTAAAAAKSELLLPVCITMVFTWTTTTAKTIKLQNYNRVMTAVTANSMNATATTGELYMLVEKI